MRLNTVVLDSGNSEALSDFYQQLLGWKKETFVVEGEDWIVVSNPQGGCIHLLFQTVDGYVPPTWPCQPGMQQQMMHIDFYVKKDDFDQEIEHAVSCGAKLSEKQFSGLWKVMFDPAGHPFCIIPE